MICELSDDYIHTKIKRLYKQITNPNKVSITTQHVKIIFRRVYQHQGSRKKKFQEETLLKLPPVSNTIKQSISEHCVAI